MSPTIVRGLLYGRQDPGPRYGEVPKRVKRETAQRILAVRMDLSSLAAGARIPSRGARRRVEALVALGWSYSKVAAAVGRSTANLMTTLGGDRVYVSTHLAIDDLFRRWQLVEPPHESGHDRGAYTRARRMAAERGYLSALAWDDIDLDDEPPTVVLDYAAGEAASDVDGAEVDEAAVLLAIDGERPRLTPAERRECVRRLHAQRWSDGRIAARIDCAADTVLRIRHELGLTAYDSSNDQTRRAA
ncbi:hypothetical protein [Microbacterium halophytorum]|uniref:hypothetical protein n=1 Tax=Microbacterium halophytorum TaxID=2067568 RepID=UPI001319F8F1|nr:hypothetical protein [Microbacterium halophytorum]